MSTEQLTQCARNVLDAWSEAGWNVGFDAAMRAMREALAALDAQPASAEAEIEALRLKLDTAYAVVIDLGGEVREPEFEDQRRFRREVESLRQLLAEAVPWIPGIPGTVGDYAASGLRIRIETALAAKEQQA